MRNIHNQRLKIHRLRNHPFVVPVLTFLILFFVCMVGFINLGGQTIGASDSRVVKVFVDNREQVVPTRAQTVKELLERLSITVQEKDIVEPGPNTEITDNGFQVNVYRARTVLVEDGGKRSVVNTAEPTLERVAQKAGVKIYPEDKVTKVPADIVEPSKALTEGLVSEKIIVEHATPATINLYGHIVSVRTHAKTVGELLAEKGIKANTGDTIQPAPETPLTPSTQVLIARFGTKLAQAEETIEPPTETVDDFNLTLGASAVREPGKAGKRAVTYELGLTNGIESSRKVLQEVIIEQPVKRVVARGRKAPVVADNKAEIMAAAGISPNEFYAADFIISHESGWRVNSVNSSGCGGLGQACPASKLANACPNWQSDPVCQMGFFNNYAVRTYGSWSRAVDVWQRQRWW